MNRQPRAPEAGANPGVLLDVHDSPNGERVASPRAQPGADWGNDQQKLRARWPTLTDADFEGVDANREVFVNRLAARASKSREEAEQELADFEFRKRIGWRNQQPH